MTTLIEATEQLDEWVDLAREHFRAGLTVHLSLSPGDGTRYAMAFIPLVTARSSGSPASRFGS